jgi:hypothetical protein
MKYGGSGKFGFPKKKFYRMGRKNLFRDEIQSAGPLVISIGPVCVTQWAWTRVPRCDVVVMKNG